jgi:hydrogenase nickel incorporation protein HypA/HybF
MAFSCNIPVTFCAKIRADLHELSIATAILERVELETAKHPGAKATKVGVRIGELAGIDADALSFGFECLVKDTEKAPLELEIELVPRVQRCPKCKHEFRVEGFDTACPSCNHLITENISGQELDIAFIEVED